MSSIRKSSRLEAALDQACRADLALLNLAYTEIRSPIDGVVGNRSARAGRLCDRRSPASGIVPARGLWVDANFKESQLARIREGQSAEIIADVLPGVDFGPRRKPRAGNGAQFSIIPPENATSNFTKITSAGAGAHRTQGVTLNSANCGQAFRSRFMWTGGTASPSAQLKNEYHCSEPPSACTMRTVSPCQRPSPFDGRKRSRSESCASAVSCLSGHPDCIGLHSRDRRRLVGEPDELSWIQSSYLIAEIIVIPLSAWLSRVMSTRWLIAASAAGFTLASGAAPHGICAR
jgi:hypothetical protein